MTAAAAAPTGCASTADLEAKTAVLRALAEAGYRFVTPSNATHRRVVGRRDGVAKDLRDVFGWSLPFEPSVLGPRLMHLMDRAGFLLARDGKMKSAVRASSVGEDLFLHSAFPTTRPDSVFLGPDSYRFANFVRDELKAEPSRGVVVDVGAGAGVGAVVAARSGRPERLILTDTNPAALDLAAANLAVADLEADLVEGRGLACVDGADLIVANPPFIAGSSGQAYRDGGGLHGSAVSLDWALAATRRLRVDGRLLMYTAAAVVDGADEFLAALGSRLEGEPVAIDYRELDPDIYGGLLTTPAYAGVERIAAVGLIVRRRKISRR